MISDYGKSVVSWWLLHLRDMQPNSCPIPPATTSQSPITNHQLLIINHQSRTERSEGGLLVHRLQELHIIRSALDFVHQKLHGFLGAHAV